LKYDFTKGVCKIKFFALLRRVRLLRTSNNAKF